MAMPGKVAFQGLEATLEFVFGHQANNGYWAGR